MKSAKKCVESVGIEPTNELGWLHLFARRLSCASLYLKQSILPNQLFHTLNLNDYINMRKNNLTANSTFAGYRHPIYMKNYYPWNWLNKQYIRYYDFRLVGIKSSNALIATKVHKPVMFSSKQKNTSKMIEKNIHMMQINSRIFFTIIVCIKMWVERMARGGARVNCIKLSHCSE